MLNKKINAKISKKKDYNTPIIIPAFQMNAITQEVIKDSKAGILIPDITNVIDAKDFVDNNHL